MIGTPLEHAEKALEDFKLTIRGGSPSLSSNVFVDNPGLETHIIAALEGFVHVRRVAEQSQPAKRVSLTEA